MVLVISNAGQLVGVRDCDQRLHKSVHEHTSTDTVSLIARAGLIDWIGPSATLPPVPPDAEFIDTIGKTVLPGFVDSHTHLVFAGSREDEFERRLRGVSYQENAVRGGGINA